MRAFARDRYAGSFTTDLRMLQREEDSAALPRLDAYYLRHALIFDDLRALHTSAFLAFRRALRTFRYKPLSLQIKPSISSSMRTALLDLYHFGHFALAEAIARLPSAPLRRVAINALAGAAYRLSHKKRRAIERNIACAFGGRIDPAKTRRITVGCFREVWQEMVDWVPAVGDRLPAAEIEIRGLAHLEQALAGGKGAILWESNGFSRRVQAKRTLHAHAIPLHQTHGETHLGVLWTPRAKAPGSVTA